MNPPGKVTEPAFYEIIVAGQIDVEWASWFEGLNIERLAAEQTRISGCLADQSALRGLLERIFDLNMQVLSVTMKDD